VRGLFAISLALAPFAASAQEQPSPIQVPQILGRGLGMVIGPYADRPPDLTLLPHGRMRGPDMSGCRTLASVFLLWGK